MSPTRETVEITLPGDISREDFETYFLNAFAFPYVRSRKAETRRAAEVAAAERERKQREDAAERVYRDKIARLERHENRPVESLDVSEQTGRVFVLFHRNTAVKFLRHERVNLVRNGVVRVPNQKALAYVLAVHEAPEVERELAETCPYSGHPLRRIPRDGVHYLVCSGQGCGFDYRADAFEGAVPVVCPACGSPLKREISDDGYEGLRCSASRCRSYRLLGKKPKSDPIILLTAEPVAR
jgi:hypothetical protein